MMYSASGGSEIGPPWQMTSTSGFTPRAASAIRWIRVDAIVQRLRALRPDRSSGRDAHVSDDQVGAGVGHALGLRRIEDVGRRQQVQLARQPDDVDFELIAHAGFLEGLAHVAIEEADGRKVLDAREAQRPQLFEEESGDDERIGAVDAGEDRRLLHDREDLVGHLLDDLVGVPVREEPRGAAASGHPVAARVVDDQQVDAAGLFAHGREARAGAAADDRLAARDLLAESFQNACRELSMLTNASCHPSRTSSSIRCDLRFAISVLVTCSNLESFHQFEQLASRRVGEVRIVDVQIQLGHLDPVHTGADGVVERPACGRIVERLSLFVDGRHAAPGQQDGDRPLRRGQLLRDARRRCAAFSSGVVRISVTLALCR